MKMKYMLGILITFIIGQVFAASKAPFALDEQYLKELSEYRRRTETAFVAGYVVKRAEYLAAVVSDDTLYLTGTIVNGSCEIVAKAITSKIRKVAVVSSMGGAVLDGACIGHLIFEAKLDVQVDGQCVSSCANYIFLAGQKKVIGRGGYVGFHGSGTQLLTPDLSDEGLMKGVKDTMGFAYWIIKLRASKDVFDKSMYIAKQMRKYQYVDEQRFFNEIGVDQRLFVQSYRRDKGSPDKKDYFVYLPSRESFQSFGVTGVSGDQRADICNKEGPCYYN